MDYDLTVDSELEYDLTTDATIDIEVAHQTVENYDLLQGKPQINGVELLGNKTSSQLGLQESLTVGANINISNGVISAIDTKDYNDLENLPTIPTKESDLTHDMGYLTEHQSLANYYTKSQVDTQITGVEAEIPTTTSDLVNDSGYITSAYHDNTKQDNLTAGRNITINNNVISATSSISVDYGTLTNKPKINSVELDGDKSALELGLVQKSVYDAKMSEIDGELDGKQDTLTAGANITITNNVISATGGGSSDYDDLTNKPSINGVTLTGNKTTSDLNIDPLPPVTSADNGKVLMVVNGEWSASALENCDGEEF